MYIERDFDDILSPEDTERFLFGECDIFAYEIAKSTRLGICAIIADGFTEEISPDGDCSTYLDIVHCFAYRGEIDETGVYGIAVDARGVMNSPSWEDILELYPQWRGRLDYANPGYSSFSDADGFSDFVGLGMIDLSEYTQVMEAVLEVLDENL